MNGDREIPDSADLKFQNETEASSPPEVTTEPKTQLSAAEIFNTAPDQPDNDNPEHSSPPSTEPVDAGEEDSPPDNLVYMAQSEEDTTPDSVLLSRLESIVFASPEPPTIRRLCTILSVNGKRIRNLLAQLQDHYADRGIQLSEISGAFVFHTHPDNAAIIRSLTRVKPMKMSRPALETLAIVAYKQPCTRADVEDVRRVDCGGTLKFLFEHDLIRVLGRKEEPGRPIIYGTSKKFLEIFNLKGLEDLPSLREYTELWEEHQELVDEEAPDEHVDQLTLPRMISPETPDDNDFSSHDGTTEPSVEREDNTTGDADGIETLPASSQDNDAGEPQ